MILSFNVAFIVYLFLCAATDFSAWALLIGVKFYKTLQSHLGHVFSHFRGISPGMAELWASTGAMWRDMFLAEAHVAAAVCYDV